jgi:hypothetical protein
LAPSFLDLEDEETVAYDARRTPAVSLPALRAECVDTSKWDGTGVADTRADRRRGRRSEPSVIILSDDDIEIVSPPHSGVVNSEVHRIETKQVTERPAPPKSTLRPVTTAEVPGGVIPLSSRHRITTSESHSDSGLVEKRMPRSRANKILFVAILLPVLMLVLTDISMAFDLPWLDCRPYLFKVWRFVAERIPWESLPKLSFS